MGVRKLTLIFAGVIVTFFLWCRDALAWGPGIHIAQGEFVFKNLALILPAIQELLKAFPTDFLYGCISADIFIGKGSRRRDDHCHNWSVGMTMRSVARKPAEEAFTYGYLSHLVADTIAHNYYIPNMLYTTSTTRKFGHLYWEFRSDVFTEKRDWKIAKEIISQHNRQMDLFMAQVVPSRIVSFTTKKRLYSTSIHLYDLERWRRTVKFVHENSRWEVPQPYIEYLKKLSFYLTIDFLHNPERARCFHYDPVGSVNIREAKKMRRLIKSLNGRHPTSLGFEIPSEVTELVETVERRRMQHHQGKGMYLC